jgi:hypothetical protein
MGLRSVKVELELYRYWTFVLLVRCNILAQHESAKGAPLLEVLIITCYDNPAAMRKGAGGTLGNRGAEDECAPHVAITHYFRFL